MKTLIIRPAALGDTLMLLPAVAYMKSCVKITLVGREPGLDLFRPYVQHCIDYEGPGWHRLFLDGIDASHPSPIPEAELAVAFLTDPEGRVERNMKIQRPQAPVHIFPPFPPKQDRTHVALYLAQCLEMTGLPVDAEKAFVKASERPLLHGKRPSMGRSVVFHPGSGGADKNHPPEFWFALIKEMSDEFPGLDKPIVLLGPAEAPLFPFFKEKAVDDAIVILRSEDMETLTSLFAETRLYVGHDSGVTHLAAMYGIPVIALFKGSSMHQWRPLGPDVRIIENEKNDRELILKILEAIRRLLC